MGHANQHMCSMCKGSGLKLGMVSILPWNHPVIIEWRKRFKPTDILPDLRKIMNMEPRPAYDPKVHGPDVLPGIYKRSIWEDYGYPPRKR